LLRIAGKSMPYTPMVPSWIKREGTRKGRVSLGREGKGGKFWEKEGKGGNEGERRTLSLSFQIFWLCLCW